jgi:predicted glutamine amidotransferase
VGKYVVIASEPITADEDWTELPEGSVLGVAPNSHATERDLLAAAHH